MIVTSGKMVAAKHSTDPKAVVITALDICKLTQILHGGGWKCVDTKKTLVTIQMGISFVWSPLLLCVCLHWIKDHADEGKWSTKRKKWRHGLFNTGYFNFFYLSSWLKFCLFVVHYFAFQEADVICPSFQVMTDIVLSIMCYSTHISFFIFISSK